MKNIIINLQSYLFFSLFFLFSCTQNNTRKDIENKLQGTWAGDLKDIDRNVTNEVVVVFDLDNLYFKKDYAIDSLGNKELIKNSDEKYRIFIHTTGDTIIEHKRNLIESLYKESFYTKLHLINKDSIKLIILFKYNDATFLGLSGNDNMAYYLKREKLTEGK